MFGALPEGLALLMKEIDYLGRKVQKRRKKTRPIPKNADVIF